MESESDWTYFVFWYPAASSSSSSPLDPLEELNSPIAPPLLYSKSPGAATATMKNKKNKKIQGSWLRGVISVNDG